MLRHYERDELVWVAPGAVRYDMADTEFLLPWLYHMREGIGPAEPQGGYAGGEGKQPGTPCHAYYEAWCRVAAEIDERLKKTKMDRYLVEAYYCRDWPPGIRHEEKVAVIAGEIDMDRREVWGRIRSAVSYISSGECRRWVRCEECGFFSGCKKKKKLEHKRYTYREWRRSRSYSGKELVRG